MFINQLCPVDVVRYAKCSAGIWWQDLSVVKERSSFFHCAAEKTDSNPFHFKVSCYMLNVLMGLWYMIAEVAYL